MNKKLLLPLIAALAGGLNSLHAQPTAFTYQGKLVDDCCPATGLYDLRVGLYPSAGPGGSSVSGTSTLLLPAVPVTNGLFTASLDFGSAVFDGSRRWLEIEVRTNNTGSYVTLSPRTEITPTPYALFAKTAGSVPTGAIQVSQLGTTGAPSPGQVLGYNGGSLVWQAPGGGPGPWLLNGNNAYYNAGNVGIGTINPNHPLTVQPPSGQDAINWQNNSSATAGGQLGFTDARNTNGWIGLYSGGARNVDIRATGNSYFNGGNFGIGTTAPSAPLHITGSRVGGPFNGNQAGPLVTNAATGTGFNFGLIAGGKTAIGAFSATGKSAYLANGTHAGQFHGDVFVDGNVGVGTPSPQGGLHVFTPGIFDSPQLSLTQTTPGDFARLRMGVTGASPWDIAVSAGTNPVMNFYIAGNNRMVLSPDGNVSVGSLTIRGGADLAEPFEMSEEKISEGSVVVIDEENPGHLKQATRAYDTRVAGIVSGANGVKAGIALHQEGVIEGGQNVALTGRVYVKADASFGTIKPGDLLTTSDIPGHAMKVTDSSKASGAILGKAMTALNDGQGMVLVLVSLQ